MAATLVDIHAETPARSALVTTPLDMAHVLFSASILSASSYALAAHELACQACEDDRIQFWHDVCQELDTLRTQANDTPARMVA